jgi:hypothetical protein
VGLSNGEYRSYCRLLDVGARLGHYFYPVASWSHESYCRLLQYSHSRAAVAVKLPWSLQAYGPMTVDPGSMAPVPGVSDLVFDLEYLPQPEVEAMTAAAVAIVVPTLFEAASFPSWEPFRVGAPGACSNVTSLPREVGDSGLLSDPGWSEVIASCNHDSVERPAPTKVTGRTWTRAGPRSSWRKTARQFLALYRYVGGRRPWHPDRHRLEQEISL